MDDKDLIRRLHQNDEAAFDSVFRTYYKWLCSFASHYLKDHEAAEEIVEDFFCHFWETCKDISINTSLKGYLFRSVHNRCLNQIRNEKVKQSYIREHVHFYADDEMMSASSAFYESGVALTELEEKVKKAIDALPDQCRTIFCLNRFDDLSYKEIADKLEISINTVKTQMTRALQKLREKLKDYLIVLVLSFLF